MLSGAPVFKSRSPLLDMKLLRADGTLVVCRSDAAVWVCIHHSAGTMLAGVDIAQQAQSYYSSC
ncbi:hypothetical protein EON66_06880 [archaeon]|nr:MAG: hypothetical protein EON66_06880 [archaeon]